MVGWIEWAGAPIIIWNIYKYRIEKGVALSKTGLDFMGDDPDGVMLGFLSFLKMKDPALKLIYSLALTILLGLAAAKLILLATATRAGGISSDFLFRPSEWSYVA